MPPPASALAQRQPKPTEQGAPADFTPTILAALDTPAGRAELVEWHWPEMIDFLRREDRLMIEMSLPPMAADASACLPEIAPDKCCFMGTLFVRWPGIAISGRSEGGHIRVIRCVLPMGRAAAIMRRRSQPDLPFLQALLAIRSAPLRSLMRLLHRELTNPADRSPEAIAALIDLIALELERLVAQGPAASLPGRLAPWQFRRIRQRLAQDATTPTLAELATLCGISPRHLHRQFVALTGTTLADYIETARMEKAKQLLADRDRPIKAVAQACGFAHANSFARTFRRFAGLSPKAFRQHAAGEAPSAALR